MSTSITRAVARLGAMAGALALALGVVVPATTVPADAVINQWRCTGYSSSNPDESHRTCVMFTSEWRRFDIDYVAGTFNRTYHQTIPFSCQVTQTTTWHASVKPLYDAQAAAVEARADVILAKAKVLLSSTIAAESSTSSSSSRTIEVPPRTWGHCYRGMHLWGATGKVRVEYCNFDDCGRSTKTFRLTAPGTSAWRMGLGRPS